MQPQLHAALQHSSAHRRRGHAARVDRLQGSRHALPSGPGRLHVRLAALSNSRRLQREVRRAQHHRSELDHRDRGRHAHSRATTATTTRRRSTTRRCSVATPTCACTAAQHFRTSELSRDHITPISRGGRDAWTNVVTACRRCNNHKAARTPEEARMQLVAVPFTPTYAEYIFLKGRECSRTRWNICSRTSRARARCTRGCATRSPRRMARAAAVRRALSVAVPTRARSDARSNSRARSNARLNQVDRAAVGTGQRRGLAPALGDRRSRLRFDALGAQVFEPRAELLAIES